MAIHTIEKAASEAWPIGLIYDEPDMDTGETISGSSTVASSPTGLTVGVVAINGWVISASISGGVAGSTYLVLFKTVTSTGKIFNNPYRDAIEVRVI